MNILVEQNGDQLNVKPEGRLDTGTAPELLEKVSPSLDGINTLILDFQDVDYISSAGLRVLLNFEQIMEDRGGVMELYHVSDIVRDVFDITGFLGFLNIK